MNTKIPVAIITAFLDMGIDHNFVLDIKEEMFQINNGCLCCSMRIDLADRLHAILIVKQEQNFTVDRIVIKTTGLINHASIAQIFIRTSFYKSLFI
jgi:G3E family GTPase